MKRATLNQSDDSRPNDPAHARPRKAARTNEPEPSTDKSDTEKNTAPNASTPMPSHDMQDVMKAVNDLKKELDEEKRERDESKKERDEMKSSLESFRLEMANVQNRLDRQEAAIKALTEAKTSQNQAPDNLEKEVATAAKAIETASEHTPSIESRTKSSDHSQADDEASTNRVSGSPLPSTERGVEWRGTNLHILNAPKDWEPPQNCPMPPEKDDLWLSHRGLMMSRHPLRGTVAKPGQSALERAMQFYGDGKDGS